MAVADRAILLPGPTAVSDSAGRGSHEERREADVRENPPAPAHTDGLMTPLSFDVTNVADSTGRREGRAQKLLPAKAALDVPLALAIIGARALIVVAPRRSPGSRQRCEAVKGRAATPNSRKRIHTRRGTVKTPPIVSPQEWEAARQHLLVKEKDLTHARDALAAERRRMPWLAVDKDYEFDGPKGKASLLDLFEGRRQLIVYRAFFEPGVYGWPDHACRGCSLVADQVAHVAHLNARDTTLVFASRAPQPDIERVKARMGWDMPWYTMTDGFDTDFGVDEWHGTNAFIRDGDRVFRTYFVNNRGDEPWGAPGATST